MKHKFYEAFGSLLSKKRDDNSAYLTDDKYRQIIDQVKIAKERKKSAFSYHCLKKYDVLMIEEEEKLIAPVVEEDNIITSFKF